MLSNKKTFGKTPVIQSYSVEPFNNGKGQLIAINLKQNTRIIKKAILPALSGGGHRIMIDLAR